MAGKIRSLIRSSALPAVKFLCHTANSTDTGRNGMTTVFPLKEVAEKLEKWGQRVERRGSNIKWEHDVGVSEIAVSELKCATIDGKTIDEVVTLSLRSPLFEDVPIAVSLDRNQFASMSALLVGPRKEQETVLSAKVCIPKHPDAKALAESIYAPLLCTEAYMCVGYAAAIAGLWRPDSPAKFGLSDHDQAPPYADPDFEEALDWATEQGCDATYSGGGIAAEFPWDPGAYSASWSTDGAGEYAIEAGIISQEELDTMRGKTSLFTLLSTECHPFFGNGLLGLVELPLSVSAEALPIVCATLNRWEHESPDLSPSLGAWCQGNHGGPAFVTFIPNELCLPTLPKKMTAWAGHRAHRAHFFLGRDNQDLLA